MFTLGISIVIPSKGRVNLLGDLLESVFIARQNYSGKSEVIVVDDSNEKDSLEIKELCKKYDCKMMYFSPSVAGKRNYGGRYAEHEIILYLDSDCLATPNLINEHLKLYEDKSVGAVLGLLEFTGEDTWFWKAAGNSQFVTSFYLARHAKNVSWGPSANFSVRKDVFIETQGFDEGFPNKPGGEDVDFGLRINKLGYKIACTPYGLVYHSKKTWIPVKDMFKRVWYYGSSDYFLMKKHPDFLMNVLPRRSLIYFLFLIITVILSFFKSWLLLISFPALLIFDIGLTSILINKCTYIKQTNFLQQFVNQTLVLTNELGFMVKALKKNSIHYWFKQIVTFDGQLESQINSGSLLLWSHFISLFILLFFSMII